VCASRWHCVHPKRRHRQRGKRANRAAPLLGAAQAHCQHGGPPRKAPSEHDLHAGTGYARPSERGPAASAPNIIFKGPHGRNQTLTSSLSPQEPGEQVKEVRVRVDTHARDKAPHEIQQRQKQKPHASPRAHAISRVHVRARACRREVRSQLGLQREPLDGLAHCEVGHDLLAPSIHRWHLVHAMEGLHDPAHASDGHATPAQDLHGVVRH